MKPRSDPPRAAPGPREPATSPPEPVLPDLRRRLRAVAGDQLRRPEHAAARPLPRHPPPASGHRPPRPSPPSFSGPTSPSPRSLSSPRRICRRRLVKLRSTSVALTDAGNGDPAPFSTGSGRFWPSPPLSCCPRDSPEPQGALLPPCLAPDPIGRRTTPRRPGLVGPPLQPSAPAQQPACPASSTVRAKAHGEATPSAPSFFFSPVVAQPVSAHIFFFQSYDFSIIRGITVLQKPPCTSCI